MFQYFFQEGDKLKTNSFLHGYIILKAGFIHLLKTNNTTKFSDAKESQVLGWHDYFSKTQFFLLPLLFFCSELFLLP